jgi:gliding motility-associated-like protein
VTLAGTIVFIDTLDNNHQYKVQIFEPQSGCTKDSPVLDASVVGIIDASLTSTPPCKDGQPIQLTTTTKATGATFAWTRDGITLPGVATAVTSQTEEGRYEVTVSKRSCNATSSLQITRAALPVGSLPNIAIICDDPENHDPATSSVSLDPGNFVRYQWSKNSISLNDSARVYLADSKGLYEVQITDAGGCTNIDQTTVLNECLPRIDAPNVFKPGSTVFNPDRKDLTNGDFWIITKFIEDEQFNVFIFNRWGEMVFSSNDRAFKWNGGFNNDLSRPAPPGTYAYVVRYVSTFRPDEGVKEKRGGVALIR